MSKLRMEKTGRRTVSVFLTGDTEDIGDFLIFKDPKSFVANLFYLLICKQGYGDGVAFWEEEVEEEK